MKGAAPLTALMLVACAGAAEQPVLSALFSASRLHDTTALNGFSMVSLDPKTDGSVLDFRIVSITPESRTPLAPPSPGPPDHARTNDEAFERAVAEMSIADPGRPADAAALAGEMASKQVTVDATVRLPAGTTTRKIYVVTLQRAVWRGPTGVLAGRWIVTALKETG